MDRDFKFCYSKRTPPDGGSGTKQTWCAGKMLLNGNFADVCEEPCSFVTKTLPPTPWEILLGLCGYIQDGSDTKVSLFWDDVTRTAHIQVGEQQFWGNSFEEALGKATGIKENSDG